MTEPLWGEKYGLWIPGEPVPKSTMKPPVVRRAYTMTQRQTVIQRIIDTDKKYAPLKRTQEYQKLVKDIALYSSKFPQFSQDDPIKITMNIFKGKHGLGDLKNIEAAIEDGLQFSGKIPNDRQITGRGEDGIFFYAEEPGVAVVVEIDPKAGIYSWLWDWFKHNRKKTLEYADMRGIFLKDAE